MYHEEIPEDTPFFLQSKDEEWLDTVTAEKLFSHRGRYIYMLSINVGSTAAGIYMQGTKS